MAATTRRRRHDWTPWPGDSFACVNCDLILGREEIQRGLGRVRCIPIREVTPPENGSERDG